MTSVEYIKQICKEKNIPISRLERDLILEYEIKQKPQRNVEKQIEKLNRKLTRLKELYLAEMISLDEYKADKDSITSQLASLTAKIAPKRLDIDKLRDFLATDIETLYGDFNADEKRFFWRSIMQEITFSSDRTIKVKFLP